MPRSRKAPSQSFLLKRATDNDCEHEASEKKRKNSDSSSVSDIHGYEEKETETTPVTSSINISLPSDVVVKTRKEDNICTSAPTTAGVATETDKRNRSLEALFVVTDNELQNISRREPEPESTSNEKIYIISNLSEMQINEEQIIITRNEEASKGDNSITQTGKTRLKSETLEPHGLKLVYTKQASESSILPYMVDTKAKRSETFTKSQSEVLSSTPVDVQFSIGRKRKHPQKPGKHICSYCGRGCAKPSVLEKHLRAHTGERPFPCLDCGFSFKTKSNLYKHCKSRTHAQKVNLSGTVVEEVVETEPNEVELSDEEAVVAESETESVSDHDDGSSERLKVVLNSDDVAGSTPRGPEELDASQTARKKFEVGKLMEWNKNIEKHEKQRTKAILEAHSQFPIRIAPKNVSGLSMDSIMVPDSSSRPKLMSQKSNPEYTVLSSDVNLGRLQSLTDSNSLSVPSASTPRSPGAPKGLSLPVVMTTETKSPLIKTSEPSITISTETVLLPHPSLGREAAQKGLQQLEELTSKLNSPSFQGIQISTSFNKLPNESMEVVVHIAKSAHGQPAGKSELKQKIEALVTATSAALATQPSTLIPANSSSTSFSRSDSKQGLSSEHIKEHIQHLISANAAIVDMPMSDAPRPRARSIFRQTSEITGAVKSEQSVKSESNKMSIPNMASLAPVQPSHQVELKAKSASAGKPLLSTQSLPSSADIMRKENLARKTDQLKKLNEITLNTSQMLGLTGDLPQCPVEGISGLSGLTIPKSSQNLLSKSKTLEESSSVSTSSNEFKIQIKLSKTQSETEMSSSPQPYIGQPRVCGFPPTSEEKPSSLQSPKETLMQHRSISVDPKMMEAHKEIGDRTIPTVKITQHPSPFVDLQKNFAQSFQNICKFCGDAYKHPETLKLHKIFYCTKDPESAAVSKSTSNFEQVQKILIANYFQKGATNLRRSISLPDGTSRKVLSVAEGDGSGENQHFKEHQQNPLHKKIQERTKIENLRQQTVQSVDSDIQVTVPGTYTLDQTPTDLSNKTKYMNIKPQSSAPIVLAPSSQGMNNSPRIMTPTSIPVLLASLKSRPLFLPQSAVLSDSVAAASPGLRSNSLGLSSHSLSIPVTTRSLSVGNGNKTPATPSGHFQAILPNSNVSTPLIGQPMVSPISLAEVKNQQQAVSDMKMRLKGKLLLKRSMSTEKMKSSDGSFSETISPGSRTPGTPISGTRPFGDQSKLAQLLTAQAKEGHHMQQQQQQQPHNSPAKRPKLGELKQMNSGQLKAVDYTDIDPPSLTSSTSLSTSSVKSESVSQTENNDIQKAMNVGAMGRKTSLLPLQISKNVEDKVSGTMATAIVIKEGSIGEGDSSTLQFYTVPVVMAQPFFCETQALSSGYRSDLSTQQQQVITLISPTLSKSLPGSKTVKELLIQKSQELAKSPMVGQKSFGDANLAPRTTKVLQYDKGINSATTQQLRDKLSTPSEKTNPLQQLSPKRSDVFTPISPSRSKKAMTLNLYGHLIATLRSTTHVSYCCVQRPQPFYVPMSTNKKISMYSNWKAAPHNPNPAGLSSKDLLTLYKSRYTSNPVYAEGGNSIPKSIGGFVTHSTYWTYHKQREGHEIKMAAQMREREKNITDKVSPSTLEKVLSKIRESTPDAVSSSYNSAMSPSTKSEAELLSSSTKSEYGATATKREKICSGGFRTNEEYTYIRGRGRGNYVCETCGIRCRKPSMLKKHIRTHTDHRPFHCRHCKFSFKTKGNLTKHMKSKAHTKKCFELELDPCTMTVEECQIDEEELATGQFSTGKEWPSTSATVDEEDEEKDGDEEKDAISLGSDDEEDTKSADLEKSLEKPKLEEGSQAPIYVALKSSESNKPALLKISQRGISSSLGTVYGFDGTSYADRALSPEKNSESTRSQNIDTEIARSLLELSKKAETENKDEKMADAGEKKETRLGNLIGALMSRTNKPLSGLNQSKDSNSVIVLDVEPMRSLSHPVISSPLSITVTDVDGDNQLDTDDKRQTSTTSSSSSVTANKRPRDLFLGVDDQPSRKRLYVPGSPLITPKEAINPQTPLNASILSYLPPCISDKVKATKSSTNRGPIIGQLIQQDSVVMTPVVSSAPSSSGFSFQFSHPFELLNKFAQSEQGSTTNESGNSRLLSSRDSTLSNDPGNSRLKEVALSNDPVNSRDTTLSNDPVNSRILSPRDITLSNVKSSSKDGDVAVGRKFIYVVDDAAVTNEKSHSAENLFKDYTKPAKSFNHSNKSLTESALSNPATLSTSLKCVHCDIIFALKEQLSRHLRSEQHFRALEALDVVDSGFYEWLVQSGGLDKMDSSDAEIFFKDLMTGVAKWKDILEKKSRGITPKQPVSEGSTVYSGSVDTISNPKEHFSKRLDYEKHNEASNERVTVEIKQQPIDIGDIEQRSFATDDNQESASGLSVYTKNNSNLKDKISEGGADGPHLCGICRRGFKGIQELRSHILTHAELRPYVCEYCDAGFTNAQSLKTHLHTHTQERPYVCGRCGDTFTQSDDLHLHMSTHSSLLPAKNLDQSKPSSSHVNQSGLKSTMSLDQSKPPKSDLSFRPAYSLDQSLRIDKSPSKLSSSLDDQGSATSSQSEDGPLVIDQSFSSAETPSKQMTSLEKQVIFSHQSNFSFSSHDKSDSVTDS